MTNGTARPSQRLRGGGMTIRVYTVDCHGQITDDRGTCTQHRGSKPLPMVQDNAFPACVCPKCCRAVTS
ncbi:hypothetical protein SAMN05444521_5462 [Streptomyces sp. 3214.6]|nr:hypothetical protein SAMN05444521_5462 [Streptomyces sp. 3214.6]